MSRRLPPQAPGSPRERFRRQGWDIFIRCRRAERPYARAVVDVLREYYGLRIWFDEYNLGEIREVRREIMLARQSSRFEVAFAGPSWDERVWRWLAPAELHSKEEGEAWLIRQRPLPGSITVLLPGFRPTFWQQLFARMPRPRFRAYGHPPADAAAIVRVYRAYRLMRAALILALVGVFCLLLAWVWRTWLGALVPPPVPQAILVGVFWLMVALLIPLAAWYYYLAWNYGAVEQHLRRQGGGQR